MYNNSVKICINDLLIKLDEIVYYRRTKITISKVLLSAGGHLGRHLEKMTLKLKSETDIHLGDEGGSIV